MSIFLHCQQKRKFSLIHSLIVRHSILPTSLTIEELCLINAMTRRRELNSSVYEKFKTYKLFIKACWNLELTFNSNVNSYDISLEFSEVIFGAEKEFELSHLETCEVCVGAGAKMGSKMRICSTCGGRGQVMRTEQTPFGMFSQVIRALSEEKEMTTLHNLSFEVFSTDMK